VVILEMMTKEVVISNFMALSKNYPGENSTIALESREPTTQVLRKMFRRMFS
jgi:hypothetical protein